MEKKRWSAVVYMFLAITLLHVSSVCTCHISVVDSVHVCLVYTVVIY